MKLLIVISIIAAGALMMAVPYHRRSDGSFVRAGAEVAGAVRDLKDLRTERARTVAALIILGLLAPVVPGVWLLGAMSSGRASTAALILGGILCIVLAVLNAGVLLLQGMNLCGGRSGSPTRWASVIPAWIVVCGIVMLVLSATREPFDMKATEAAPVTSVGTP